jgi:hypothetical protein
MLLINIHTKQTKKGGVKIPTAETANKEAAIKVFILAIDNQKIKTLCWKRRTVNESREVRGRFYRLEKEGRRTERRMALLYERRGGGKT